MSSGEVSSCHISEVSSCHISGVVADLTEWRTRREAGDAAARGCLRH